MGSNRSKVFNSSIISISVLLVVISLPFATGNSTSETQNFYYRSPGENQAPIIVSITIQFDGETKEMTDGEELTISEDDVYIVFFQGNAIDEFTSQNKLEWDWNITVPTGEWFKMESQSWDIEMAETGPYEISLTVSDDEGGSSDPISIKINVEKREMHSDPCFGIALIPGLIMITFLSCLVIIRKREKE